MTDLIYDIITYCILILRNLNETTDLEQNVQVQGHKTTF